MVMPLSGIQHKGTRTLKAGKGCGSNLILDESFLKNFKNTQVEIQSLVLHVTSLGLRRYHVWPISVWVMNGAAGSRAISMGGVCKVGRESRRREEAKLNRVLKISRGD